MAPLDIDRQKAAMKGNSPATVANALELLRRLVNYGARNNLRSSLEFTILLPYKDNVRVEYLEPVEVERLVKILDSWESQNVTRMLRPAKVTGLRRSEIFKPEDHDLDFLQELLMRP